MKNFNYSTFLYHQCFSKKQQELIHEKLQYWIEITKDDEVYLRNECVVPTTDKTISKDNIFNIFCKYSDKWNLKDYLLCY